jgi:hypothetical protein
MLQLPSECGETQPRHVHDRLEEDRPAHLGDAFGAIREADGHFDDGEAFAQRAVRPLDLEGVALRVDRVEIDGFEDTAPVALEAAGEIADAHSENQTGVQRAAPGDEPPPEPPVRGAATGHVARAEREVGAGLARGDQPRHVLWVV